MTTPAPPDQRQWVDFTRNREFPLSGMLSVLFHLVVLGLLLFGVLQYFFDGPKPGTIEIEPVAFIDPPGIGNRGHDTELRHGTPIGTDATGAIENPFLPSAKPTPPDTEVVIPEIQPKLPNDPDGTPVRAKPLVPLPQLTSLLKGLPSGRSTKGDGGPGPGTGGVGKGTKGTGTGPDGTIKSKRMMRWTLFFSTNGSNDYLRQMKSLGVILGVQMPDQSILLIRDLSKRPAMTEMGARIEDRIFWMDDNPQSVRAMAAELQLTVDPWRVIAFFPEWVEKKLLERELLYGKSFGRNSEDAIAETKFRVEFRNGEPRFIVVEQH